MLLYFQELGQTRFCFVFHFHRKPGLKWPGISKVKSCQLVLLFYNRSSYYLQSTYHEPGSALNTLYTLAI